MQQHKVGAGRCAENWPAHHTAWVLSPDSSVPEHHLQPAHWLLLHQWSPGM